jgi:hypothetical protein
VDSSFCLELQGISQGAGTTCATVNCPLPPEACCFADGSCTDLDANDCIVGGGAPQPGDTCATASCPQSPLTYSITNIDHAMDDEILVEWTAITGRIYKLQSITNLNDVPQIWSDIGLPVTTPPGAQTDSNATGNGKSYRVISP